MFWQFSATFRIKHYIYINYIFILFCPASFNISSHYYLFFPHKKCRKEKHILIGPKASEFQIKIICWLMQIQQIYEIILCQKYLFIGSSTIKMRKLVNCLVKITSDQFTGKHKSTWRLYLPIFSLSLQHTFLNKIIADIFCFKTIKSNFSFKTCFPRRFTFVLETLFLLSTFY